MKRLLTLPLLAYLACAPTGMVLAEKADRQKPMNIESDALRHDELQQTSVFTGRVVLNKGSIVMRGTRLEVRQGADGYQSGTVTAEAGQRAFFRQKRDAASGSLEEFVEGEAEVIEYNGHNDSVRLLRHAELRRYRGSALSDEVTGATIVYNSLTDVFTVDGTKTHPGAAATAGSRVRAVLAPKDPPPRPPSATTAPLSTPTPVQPLLRPSTALGSDKP